jgi:hypothetical protein
MHFFFRIAYRFEKYFPYNVSDPARGLRIPVCILHYGTLRRICIRNKSETKTGLTSRKTSNSGHSEITAKHIPLEDEQQHM